MFHGCYHDASGSWPYDPDGCTECLGLPEEVAHVKQALRMGYAVLAVESRNRSRSGRCFSSGKDVMTSDQMTAPYVIQVGRPACAPPQSAPRHWPGTCVSAWNHAGWWCGAGCAWLCLCLPGAHFPAYLSRLASSANAWCLQNFLYENSLQYLPVYTMGISAGAAFAVKIPKAFYEGEWVGRVSGSCWAAFHPPPLSLVAARAPEGDTQHLSPACAPGFLQRTLEAL